MIRLRAAGVISSVMLIAIHMKMSSRIQSKHDYMDTGRSIAVPVDLV